MKKFKYIFLIILVVSCMNTEKEAGNGNPTGGVPRIAFESTEHDFGEVVHGEKVGWYFKYRNEGNADLIITRVSASCGCTAPDYDRKPLSPGEEAVIKVVYDSSGRSGKEIKTVSIESNAEPSMVKLTLMVEVVNN